MLDLETIKMEPKWFELECGCRELIDNFGEIVVCSCYQTIFCLIAGGSGHVFVIVFEGATFSGIKQVYDFPF